MSGRQGLRSRPAGLPPLWVSASGVAALVAVLFGASRWLNHLISSPGTEDFRLHVVAARIGLSYGWSHIYDIGLQKAVSAQLDSSGYVIDAGHLFISPPPSAWLVVPLTGLPLQVGFAVWSAVNLIGFVAVGWLVCPGSRFNRGVLLLVSLAVWPVQYEFWLGQTVIATLALLAVAWLLLERGRNTAAGVVLALAFCVKPQVAFLIPLTLLVSGRWRPVAACAATGAVLAGTSLASIGVSGFEAWLRDVALVRSDPFNAPLTYSYLFGSGSIATVVEIALGITALVLAWYARDRPELVFALGIVGTTASATYLHEDDMAILVLAAWVVLRSRPSLPQSVWLLAGVAAAQFIAIGLPVPMLLWEPLWIMLLGLEPRLKRRPTAAMRDPGWAVP